MGGWRRYYNDRMAVVRTQGGRLGGSEGMSATVFGGPGTVRCDTYPPAVGAEDAITSLVEAARRRAGSDDPEARRQAFSTVLAKLRVPPEALPAWCDGLDVVGSAYERLLSRSERRDLGQLYTPFWAG